MDAVSLVVPRTIELKEYTEDLLASGLTPKRAASELVKKKGMSRRQAQRYVNTVYLEWAQEAQREGSRDDKRSQIRASLWHLYQLAIQREAVTIQGEFYPNPDIRGAATALETLCRLDALLEQPNASPVLVAEISVLMQQHYGLGALEAHGEEVEPKRLNGKGKSNGHG